MATQTTTSSLTVTRTIKASVDRVFDAWTQPEQMKRWAAPEGLEVQVAEVDLTVGGRYHIRMLSGEGVEYNAVGVYREVTRPNRLVYTWSWEEKEHDVGETLVTVEFKAQGENTEVVIVHEGFPATEARDGHEQGWNGCLDRFEQLFG